MSVFFDTRLMKIPAPSCFIEQLGRQFFMDFGFAAFLDKFEKYFGELMTRVLVGLMGLAVVSACISLFGALAFNIIGALSDGYQRPLRLGLLIFQIIMAPVGALLVIDLFRLKKQLVIAENTTNQARQSLTESQNILETMKLDNAEFKKYYSDQISGAQLILESAIASALKDHLVSREEVDQLRSLLGTVLEKQR